MVGVATRICRFAAALLTLLTAACGEERSTVVVNPAERHQTISGWEAHHQSGVLEPDYLEFRDDLLSLAVNDLGINRIRIEAWSGVEQPHDWYSDFRSGLLSSEEWKCHRFATTNDNDDPAVINWSGFHFTQLDEAMENVVLPMQRLLAERGEELYVNLTYDSFILQCPGAPYIHDSIPEYTEFALATFLHLREKYGFEPDAWEMILEPDNSNWRGVAIGEAMVATGDRLRTHGFTPDFIAPSDTNLRRAIRDLDAIVGVPRALDYLTEFSYHRYGGVSEQALRAVGARGRQYGLRTSMLEHIGSGHEDLHADLVLADVSAWQQFALAFRTGDNGAQYFVIGPDGGLRMGDRTRYLQQYFRYVRAGAVRIGATTTSGSAAPTAFIDESGAVTVVAYTTRRTRLRLEGLPSGRYGVTYTTESTTGEALPEAEIPEGEALEVAIPAAGVITVYSIDPA